MAPFTRIYSLFESGLFFASGLTYRPHVSGERGHPKRILSKTLSRVETFDNAGFSFTRGPTKMELFFNTMMTYIIYF